MADNDKNKIAALLGAWKIALGVAGALAGVLVIVVLLAILLKFAYVKPGIVGGMSDEDRYKLLSEARAQDEKLLHTYGWVDKSKGIVRLPVDIAMAKLLEEQNARTR